MLPEKPVCQQPHHNVVKLYRVIIIIIIKRKLKAQINQKNVTNAPR